MVHIPFPNPDSFPQKEVQEHKSFADGKEYIIALHEGIDYDQFWSDMENSTSGLSHVPDRNVRVLNELPTWQRICHYVLTDAEAEILKHDPRVRSVSPPFDTIPGLVRTITSSQIGDFNKPFGSYGPYKNWGLLRANYAINPYTLTTNALNVPSKYDYTLDGTNVDVVIMDTGIQADHPEFTDAAGVSRLKKITWLKEAGFSEYCDLNSSIQWRNVSGDYTGPSITHNGTIHFIRPWPWTKELTWWGDVEGIQIKWPNSIQLGIDSNNAANPKLGEPGYPPPADQRVTDNKGINLFHGATDSNSAYVIRYQGQTDWGSAHNAGIEIDWQIKFCNNNAMEITMIRHDYSTGRFKNTTTGIAVGGKPEFALTTMNEVTTNFTSAFQNKTQLVGASAQPISVVLTTNDNGETWTVKENYRMVFTGGVWQAQIGTATIVNPLSLATKIQSPNFTQISGLGSYYYLFGVPFSFKIGTSLRKNFYTDYHGHGTHCAGISAGKTFGWAKNANIYAMKFNDLTDSNKPDWENGFDELTCWNLIKLFHTNKPVNPVTGVKNPTVVNMSFGSSFPILNVLLLTGGKYRNVNWTPTANPVDDLGNRGVGKWKYYTGDQAALYGYSSYTKGFWYSLSCNFDASDVGLDELAQAGVICCVAAGNNGMRADNSTGADYNNYFNYNYYGTISSYHYNRGCSPQSPLAVMVGAIDFVYPTTSTDPTHARATNNINNLDQVANFSNSGSLVDMYAPGVNITSSTSTNNILGGVGYYENNQFLQTSISGTSMATPQVVGLLALYMQQNPTKTPAQAKQWLIDTSKASLYSTNLDSDYSTYYSLKGGPNRQMFNTLITATVILPKPVTNDVGTAASPIEVAKNSTNNLVPIVIIGTATSLGIPVLATHGTTNLTNLLCTYTPTPNYVGTDTFKYTATNSSGTSDAATVYIKVIDTTVPPVAKNITATVLAKSTNNIMPLSVTGLYTAAFAATQPLNGVATVSGNTLYYTPKFVTVATSDFFVYAVSNSGGTSNIATVSISIAQPPYPIPEAFDIAVTVPANTTTNIITNTNNSTTINFTSSPRSGTINYSSPGVGSPTYLDIKTGISFAYTPTPGFTGTDTLTYSGWQYHTDGSVLKSTTATITITVIDQVVTTRMSISNGVVMTNGINLRLI